MSLVKPEEITECRRCGVCCSKGGPLLHAQDLELFQRRDLDWRHVLCLRAGELAYDPVESLLQEREEPDAAPGDAEGRLRRLSRDVVKLKGKDRSWMCMFYIANPPTCVIYGARPSECRAQECWAPDKLIEMYHTDRIGRMDLLGEASPLAELARTHEARCAYSLLAEPARALVKSGWPVDPSAEAKEALAELLEAVRFDQAMRQLVFERSAEIAADPASMAGPGATEPAQSLELIFGRPLAATLSMYGLAVQELPGRTRLVRSGRPREEAWD